MSTNDLTIVTNDEQDRLLHGAFGVIAAIESDAEELIVTRTKPNIREIAQATTMNLDLDGVLDDNERWRPVVAGDKVQYWNGACVAIHVVTKGEMLKVERYRARTSKQREHEQHAVARSQAQLRREARRVERQKAHERQVEAERRHTLAVEAVARIAAACGK